MNGLPSWRNYGDYSSNNYGVHSLEFQIGGLRIWFSYDTPVAFYTHKTGIVIRKNDWQATTGKHLNWIDPDKSKRIDGELFELKLAQVLKEFNLST